MKQNSLVEKLSLQSESFQEGFELLTRSNSFEELTKNFRHILRGNFITTNIHLFHKPTTDSAWNRITSDGNASDPDAAILDQNSSVTVRYYEGGQYTAAVVLPLFDNSYLGILFGSKLDKSGFNDFDKITLQILLQVFSSAHKSFIDQKNEKKLIFELNEKVLQLNNLIDTGIELSRYENQNFLFDLALGRVITLTNASSAVILIGDKNSASIENHFAFPVNTQPDVVLSSLHKIESSFFKQSS